jgi:hypothetical protein
VFVDLDSARKQKKVAEVLAEEDAKKEALKKYEGIIEQLTIAGETLPIHLRRSKDFEGIG